MCFAYARIALVIALLMDAPLSESVLSAFFQASQSDLLVVCLSLGFPSCYTACLTVQLSRAVRGEDDAALMAMFLSHGRSSSVMIKW